MAHQISDEMRRCVANCTECHQICTETAAHCLELGGKHADPHHVHVLLDCAQICATSADFMLRGSELHPRTCGVCAEACARMADGDELMRRCADVCRRCADSCGRMAA